MTMLPNKGYMTRQGRSINTCLIVSLNANYITYNGHNVPLPKGGSAALGASPCLRESGRPDRDTSQRMRRERRSGRHSGESARQRRRRGRQNHRRGRRRGRRRRRRGRRRRGPQTLRDTLRCVTWCAHVDESFIHTRGGRKHS